MHKIPSKLQNPILFALFRSSSLSKRIPEKISHQLSRNLRQAGLFVSIRMSSFSAIAPVLPISFKRPIGKEEIQHRGRIRLIECGLAIPSIQSQPFQCGSLVSRARRPPSSAVVCAAALNARCGAEQTQTVTHQSYIITTEPIQVKEKSPDRDVGGTGFPPHDDCGIGGGQGSSGGGNGCSGGSDDWLTWFFFGSLVLIGFLKDEEPYWIDEDRRRRRYRRYKYLTDIFW